jgi:heme/copper-type cytochrome/quinol oxidase subunit 2
MENKSNSIIMAFIITMLFMLLMMFSSCSIFKHKEKVKIDTEEKKEVVSDTKTETQTDGFKTSFTIEPIDLSKPITFGGKTYTNTKIVYITDKTKTNENKVEAKKEVEEVKQTVKAKESIKKVEFNMNWLIWIVVILGFVFIICFVILLRLYLKNATKIVNLAENVSNLVGKL